MIRPAAIAAAVIGAGGLLAFAAGFFVGQVGKIYERGYRAGETARALEQAGEIEAARAAARAAAAAEIRAADARLAESRQQLTDERAAYERRLERARNDDPDFDRALRVALPASLRLEAETASDDPGP